jgi:hypothetical protein
MDTSEHHSQGVYMGATITVIGGEACPLPAHDLVPVLHYGEPGTGFVMCTECSAVGADPFPDKAADAPRAM